MDAANLKIQTGKLQWEEGKVTGFFFKELISLANGSFKLVKIAPHAIYPLHYHPDKIEFIYVLEGKPEFKIGSTHFTGQSNEFFIFPANEKHAIENLSEIEAILLVGAIKN